MPSNFQQIIDAVENSILPGGFLVLSVTQDTDSSFSATVGRIGQLGEWHGSGRTPEDALQAAVTTAEEDDDA